MEKSLLAVLAFLHTISLAKGDIQTQFYLASQTFFIGLSRVITMNIIDALETQTHSEDK